MQRRRFLSLLGLGAAGSLAGTGLARSRDTRAPEVEEIVPFPRSGSRRVVWSVETTEPFASLTFDDGPDPSYTPRILEILDHYKVKATFMVMGYNAVKHAGITKDMLDAGHEIGGHGWKHLNLTKATVAETRQEILHGTKMIESITGQPLTVFRPPYGRFSEEAMQLLGHAKQDLVIWSVTRGDLGWKDPRQIASHVARSLEPGGIVDLHDGLGRGTFNPDADFTERIRVRRETEIAALPQMIEQIRERGLRLKTVSDVLRVWQPDHAGA
jgi:peptidoglycan/xylan/chitin deacetylase (PgdA/CDA1 family)